MKKLVIVILISAVLALVLSSQEETYAFGRTFRSATSRSVGSITHGRMTRINNIDKFHFEVPSRGSGAYNIFTTGSTDTTGRLFERNGVWPWQREDLLLWI